MRSAALVLIVLSSIASLSHGSPTEFAGEECTGPDGKCELCQADCDRDRDCVDGLECFQRDDDEDVPGCVGDHEDDGWDYCYDPNYTEDEPTPAPTSAPTSAPEAEATPEPDIETTPDTGTDPEERPGVVLNGEGTEFGPIGVCTGAGGLCLECEGDCDNDEECGDGFVCYQRDDDDAVPGCYGFAVTDKDYCITEANMPEPVQDFVVVPGTGTEFGELGVCTGPNELCMECEGDCDGDYECGEGYVCYERDGNDAVPGCFGLAATDKDYCILEANAPVDPDDEDPDDEDPDDEDPVSGTPVDGGANFPGGGTEFGTLGVCSGPEGLCMQCEGDCDDDDECGDGLVCKQRDGDEPVLGCYGYAVSDKDYCHDPNYVTAAGTTSGAHSPIAAVAVAVAALGAVFFLA